MTKKYVEASAEKELAWDALQKFCRSNPSEGADLRGYVIFLEYQLATAPERSPRVGDGSGDAAIAIGEHAFKAGYEAAAGNEYSAANAEAAWSNYDPPEDIKALS